MWWKLILQGLGAGLIVVVIAEVARRYPRLAAALLAVPVIPLLALVTIYLRDQQLADASRMSRDIVILILLFVPSFIPLALAPSLRLGFWQAYVLGLCLAGAATIAYVILAPRGS